MLLVGWQEGHPACKNRVVRYWCGCLSGARCRLAYGQLAQLMPLPLTVSCFSEIQIGFTFLVPVHLGSPVKRAVKRVCVRARTHARTYAHNLQCQCLFLFVSFVPWLLCLYGIKCHRRVACYRRVEYYISSVDNFLPSVLWCCWLDGRKGIRPVKTWVLGCWCGYMSGARWRLAYCPADATATHCLLLQ